MKRLNRVFDIENRNILDFFCDDFINKIIFLPGKDNIVEYLLNHGADVNATDDVKSTSLHRAAEKSSLNFHFKHKFTKYK